MKNNYPIIENEVQYFQYLELMHLRMLEAIRFPDPDKEEEIILLTCMLESWERRQEIREFNFQGEDEFDLEDDN